MAGQLQIGAPAVSRGERVGARFETAAPFAVAAGATCLLAIDHGGYLPTTWGWAALALAWVAGVSLVLRETRVSRLELGWVGGLTVLTAWTAASMFWTSTQTQTALEVERTFVYLLAAIAVVAVERSLAYRAIVWGVWAGSTLACLYALATRLFPERLGITDPIAGYRLSDPIGYWNGLGLLAAIAIVLAVGIATVGSQWWHRPLAAAVVPLLLPTLYFTFSRGAWVALAGALVVVFLLSTQRVRLAASLLVQAFPAAIALSLAYGTKPLHEKAARLSAATHAGHTLAWRLLLLAAGAAALKLVYDTAARRIHVPTQARRGFAALLLAAMLAGVVGVLVHYGGPTAAFDRARHSIDSGDPGRGSNLNQRLFSLSSNGRLHQWHIALDEWDAHPLLGGGAGSFADYWAAAGPHQPQLLDVHSLYVETLAELGPIGLVVLVVTLLIPLAAAVRARHRSLVPIAAGAYLAWLVHVAYDWDWELPGVTIAAILCAGALLVAVRREGTVAPWPPARSGLLATASIAAVAAFFGLLGNRALASGSDALHAGRTKTAIAAAKDARRWAPWSSAPWGQLALIYKLRGDRAAARAAYEQAVRKDPRDWELWLQLVVISRGTERAHALGKLRMVNPGAASGVTRKP